MCTTLDARKHDTLIYSIVHKRASWCGGVTVCKLPTPRRQNFFTGMYWGIDTVVPRCGEMRSRRLTFGRVREARGGIQEARTKLKAARNPHIGDEYRAQPWNFVVTPMPEKSALAPTISCMPFFGGGLPWVRALTVALYR